MDKYIIMFDNIGLILPIDKIIDMIKLNVDAQFYKKN